MTFEWTDLTYQQKLAGNSALFIFPLCVLLAYLILAAQYNSWLLPLAVLLIVPMCLLSAIAGVWLVGGDNNVFVQIGLVVLVGLAAKNAILIVEFARTLEAEGARALEAVVEACRLRLRPILMTSLAFIAGVVPLVMASGAGRNAPGDGRRGIRRDARGDAVRPVPHAGVLRTGTGTGGAPGATRRRQPGASGGRPSMKPYLRSSLSALILLGGCAAVGPDYAPPSASAPASFGAMPAGIDGGGVEIEWWRGFDEPALESLIQRALAANLDIALAGARLDEAKALLRENREEFLPRGGPAFDYQARRRGEVETPAGQQRDIETYRGALDASWEIDLFGRVRRSVEAAEAQAGSREALLRNVQASVAATVAMTWFQLQGHRGRTCGGP